MNTNQLNKLRSDAQNYSANPRESAWLKLDSKLERNRNNQKLNIYKRISIAAVMVAVLGMTTLFVSKIETSPTFADYQVSDITNTTHLASSSESNIYEITKLIELKTAYQKLASTGKM